MALLEAVVPYRPSRDVTLLGAFYQPAVAPLTASAPSGRTGLTLASRPAFQGRSDTSMASEGRRTDGGTLFRIHAAAIQQLLAEADDAFSTKRNRSEALVLN